MREGSEATRRSLLEAAAHLFDERGYAGTSISAIGRRSGLTSGAIYFHYSSKDNLARAVVEEHFASWPPLITRISAAPAPALDKIICMSYVVARAFRDDIVVRAGARLWLERTAINVPLPPPFVDWINTLSELLGEARAEGGVDTHVDPPTTAAVLVCAFFGTHTVSDALDSRLLIEERLTHLWLHLLPGLQSTLPAAALVERARGCLDQPEPPPSLPLPPVPT